MTEQLQLGDRVVLEQRGTVRYERSGYVQVQWDDGRESLEWRADLELESDHDSWSSR